MRYVGPWWTWFGKMPRVGWALDPLPYKSNWYSVIVSQTFLHVIFLKEVFRFLMTMKLGPDSGLFMLRSILRRSSVVVDHWPWIFRSCQIWRNLNKLSPNSFFPPPLLMTPLSLSLSLKYAPPAPIMSWFFGWWSLFFFWWKYWIILEKATSSTRESLILSWPTGFCSFGLRKYTNILPSKTHLRWNQDDERAGYLAVYALHIMILNLMDVGFLSQCFWDEDEQSSSLGSWSSMIIINCHDQPSRSYLFSPDSSTVAMLHLHQPALWLSWWSLIRVKVMIMLMMDWWST